MNHAAGLFSFCGADAPTEKAITDMQGKKINPLWVGPHEPPNMRKDPDFPPYGDWPPAWKDELWGLVGETAAKLGYAR
jgi:hypothetical protein